MIGRIEADYKGHHLEIILEDDGSVRADNDTLRRFVELELRKYNRDYSPADGPYGVFFLNNLAEKLKGKAILEEKEPYPPGTIF